MTRELKIEQTLNGYLVIFLDFTGSKRIFTTFAEMMDYLFGYFDEKIK